MDYKQELLINLKIEEKTKSTPSIDGGLDVLKMWMFDSADLGYLATINAAKLEDEIKNIETILSKISSSVMSKIISAGKDYPNRESREAELARRLNEEKDYQEYRDFLEALRLKRIRLVDIKAQDDYWRRKGRHLEILVKHELEMIKMLEMKAMQKAKLESDK